MRKNKLNRKVWGDVVTLIMIIIIGIFMLIPSVYVIAHAFKPLEELYRFPPTLFPQHPTTKNFSDLFGLLNESTMPFLRYVFNTVLLTVVSCVGQIFIGSLCAYSLAKIPYPGSKFLFNLIIFSLMFSGTVTSVPSYIIFCKLHLIDTYWGMLLPSLISTMGFYLMKQFMQTNVPDALLEAARIDGASELMVFAKIAMPLIKPAWFTLIILSIQSHWSATSSHTYREVFKTMPEALSQVASGGMERVGASAAISLVMMSVPLICFIVMQSKIMDTMASAGIK